MSKKDLKQLKNMLDGWKNVFISDEEVEELAKERLIVCEQCPHKKKFTCSLCGCPLKAKLRAVEAECPDNRWEK
jgi:hypothetical protein